MDDEKLIKEVKKYTCLYARNSIGYRNVRTRAKAWDEISATMDVNISNCQTRWRSIKDRYLREMKKKACDSRSTAVPTKKPWKLRPQLAFLKEHLRPRSKSTSVASPPQQQGLEALDEQLFFPHVEVEDGNWENSSEIDEVMEVGPGTSSTPYSSPSMSQQSLLKKESTRAEFSSVMTMARDRSQWADPNKNYLIHLSEKLEELPKEEKEQTKIFFLNYVYNQIKDLKKKK